MLDIHQLTVEYLELEHHPAVNVEMRIRKGDNRAQRAVDHVNDVNRFSVHSTQTQHTDSLQE